MVVERFLRLMGTTDFVDRARADAVLDAAPLYAFPRDERVFRAVAESQRARLDAGIEEAVRAIDAPVLVIHGAEDTDPARARAVADLAPRGRYVEIGDAAHTPWLERPESLRAALRAFLVASAEGLVLSRARCRPRGPRARSARRSGAG